MNVFKKFIKVVMWLVVVVIFIATIALFFFIRSDNWSNYLISYLDRQVRNRYNLKVTTAFLRGSVFSNLHFNDVRLASLSETELLTINDLAINYRLPFLFKKDKSLQKITIDSLSLFYPLSVDTLLSSLRRYKDGDSGDLRVANIEIDKLNLFNSDLPDSSILSNCAFTGSITFCSDSVSIQIDSSDINFVSLGEFFTLSEGSLTIKGNKLIVRDCTLKNLSSKALVSGEIALDSLISGKFDLIIDDLLFAERFPKIDQIMYDRDYLDIDGSLFIKGGMISVDFGLKGKVRDLYVDGGELKAEYSESKLNVRKFALKSNGERIEGSLKTDFAKRFISKIKFGNFDLERWDIFPSQTKLNGLVSVRGKGNITEPDEITLAVSLGGSAIDTLNFDRIEGEVLYKNNSITVLDTFFLSIGNTILNLSGTYNLGTQFVDGQCYFNSSDLGKIASVLKADTLVGDVEGFIEAKGIYSNPDFRGWIKGNNFGVPQLYFDESIARFGAISLGEKRFGDIFIESIDGKGDYINSPIPLASLIIRIEGDTSFIKSFRIGGKGRNIELQGSVVKLNDFFFNRVKAEHSGNYIVNLEPIHVQLNQDTLNLHEVDFKFNEGKIQLSAQAIKKKLNTAKLQIADIAIDPLNAMIVGEKGISGVLNGNVDYKAANGSSFIKGNLALYDGRFLDQDFKTIKADLKMQDDRISIYDFYIQDKDTGFVQGKGYLTCAFPFKADQPVVDTLDTIDLNMNFDDFRIVSFDPFLFPGVLTDGNLSGDISVRNRTGDPVIIYNLTANNPVFDKLSGDELIARGRYQNNKLQFTDLLLRDEGGTYKGYGYLPFGVTVVPGVVHYLTESPMSMNFSASTTTLPFLTNYMSDIDDINGDFNLALSLSGSPEDPIRSGNLSAKDALIYITSIENPVQSVEGSAIIENNMMDIVSFTGMMIKPEPMSKIGKISKRIKAVTLDVIFPPKVTELKPNLTVEGTVDLSQFFDPYLNVRIVGEDLYIRTLLAEQEGVVDGVFTMIGRDSLAIEGDIEVKEFIVRNEFAGSGEIIEEKAKSNRYSSTNVHATIPGNLFFRNSQLDCELEGEMWIIRNDDEPYRFSGDLDVRRGKFFFYGSEFVLESGSITFPPYEFNPKLDITARVNLAQYGYKDSTGLSELEDEYVTVTLTGDLDRPLLVFESVDNKYSQSDILKLLTHTQRMGDEFFNQQSLSADALNVFGAYFERQLERNVNRIIGLDAFELRTQGNISPDIQPEQLSVLLGQRVGPNLFFTYDRNLSRIDPNWQMKLEYRLNPTMSIVGGVNQYGDVSINYRYKYRY